MVEDVLCELVLDSETVKVTKNLLNFHVSDHKDISDRHNASTILLS